MIHPRCRLYRMCKVLAVAGAVVLLELAGSWGALDQELLPPPAPVAQVCPPEKAKDGAEPPKKEGGEKKEEPFWAKVPPLQPYPRLGAFTIPPKGPGYYSLKDVLEGNWREAPPKFPYPPTSLNANP